MQTYGGRHTQIPAAQYMSSIALLVSVLVTVVVGALAGLVSGWFDIGVGTSVAIGSVVAAGALSCLVVSVIRHVNRAWARPDPTDVGTE